MKLSHPLHAVVQEIAFAASVLWLVIAGVPLSAQNLIVNGDFEAGNVGFSSDYTYDDTPPMDGYGYYAIGTNPKTWNSFWSSFGDHTSGTGKMFIADGAVQPNKTVWQQTVTVVSGTPYIFSYWAASSYPQRPANLRTYINGVQVGSDLQLPSTTGEWVQFSVVWNSGSATSATIRLVDLLTYGLGNDFVLDDISLQVVPEPASVWGMMSGFAAVWLRCGRARKAPALKKH